MVYLTKSAIYFFGFINISGALGFLNHTLLCQICVHFRKQRKHKTFSKPGLPYDQTRRQSLQQGEDYFLFLHQARKSACFCSFISLSPATQNMTVYFWGLVSLDWPSSVECSLKILCVLDIYSTLNKSQGKLFKGSTSYSQKNSNWKKKIQTIKVRHKTRKKIGKKKPQQQYCLSHKQNNSSSALQTDLRSHFIYKHIPYSSQQFNF